MAESSFTYKQGSFPNYPCIIATAVYGLLLEVVLWRGWHMSAWSMFASQALDLEAFLQELSWTLLDPPSYIPDFFLTLDN